MASVTTRLRNRRTAGMFAAAILVSIFAGYVIQASLRPGAEFNFDSILFFCCVIFCGLTHDTFYGISSSKAVKVCVLKVIL